MRSARALKAILCAAALCCLAIPAPAPAAPEPLLVFTPVPPAQGPTVPPPVGRLNGPCGLGVDSLGRFYVSDYYHHAVDVFGSAGGYVSQVANVDPLGGPCGLALDSTDRLYVNNYHRNVTRFNPAPSFGAGTIFPLPPEDAARHLPTGVAVDTFTDRVYVNHRTYVSVLDSSGAPIEELGEPVVIGEGSLGDGYGVAVSQFPATAGRVYVPDAATDTVKVYDPLIDKDTPIAEIKNQLNQPFSSLRDSAIAVDRATGQVYFTDNQQPEATEKPQASIYVYSALNAYSGRLKYNVIDAHPPGLAIDNSAQATQGRVYVTSGDALGASVYAYGPNSAVSTTPLPPLGSGLQPPVSASGSGSTPSAATEESESSSAAKAAPAASASVVTQKDNLRVSVEGALAPKRLPRKGSAPISVSIGWEIATVDGSPPPDLKKLRIEINREGHFETEGLPSCPYAKIQPATTKRALSNCRPALVGRGSFSANISLKGQEGESYTAKGQLLVFNGEEKGKPVLFGQIYSASPFATSFVIVFKVSKIRKGDYGTALTAVLPASLRSWGDLTGIQMRLSRKYGYGGEKRSYVSAGCPAPKGFTLASFDLARTSFSFGGGDEVSVTSTGVCRARG
jgi:hypothetical protein